VSGDGGGDDRGVAGAGTLEGGARPDLVDPADRAVALALHWLRVGKPERALEALGSASRVPGEARVWYLRAVALDQAGDRDRAESAVLAGLDADPEHVPLLGLLSRLHAARGDLAEAERAILSALRLDPRDPELLVAYARLVARAGQLDKARELLERAAALDPEDPEVRASRALLAYVRGESGLLEEEARALLERDPFDDAGHRLLVLHHFSEARPERALPHAREVVRSDLRDADAVEGAREAQLWTHPLMLPLRPFARYGAAKTWIAAVVGLTALRSVSPTAALVGGCAWLGLCVYSWTAPPLLRRWLRRRRA
jgi:Flp pilus assembly protein TadD